MPQENLFSIDYDSEIQLTHRIVPNLKYMTLFLKFLADLLSYTYIKLHDP